MDNRDTESGNDLQPQSAADQGTQDSKEENNSPGRRQFFTGVASAVGAGLVLGGVEHQTKKAQTTNPANVRSRIISRIQDDLKKSKNELLHGYDKPDSPSGSHGRYTSGIMEEEPAT